MAGAPACHPGRPDERPRHGARRTSPITDFYADGPIFLRWLRTKPNLRLVHPRDVLDEFRAWCKAAGYLMVDALIILVLIGLMLAL